MESNTPALPTVPLCDVLTLNGQYCRQKPRYGGHAFCSWTCAMQPQPQTATLCNRCQKKPKYQTFDFCGQSCASLAAAASGGKNKNPDVTVKPPVPTVPAGGNVAQTPANSPINPLQWTNLVAQHIPQAHNFMAELILVTTGGTAQQLSASAVAAASSSPASQACFIPGCGKPVYVNPFGVGSDYCSQRHRKEAVLSGLVRACIMCLTRPQSDTDYFCGRDCREAATNKPADP
ncbi:hypothetical protein FB45DRAFT_1036199 [Roridomyces roridus]|uniref:Uncharacterized protein n=1 Tax=Roridomyces roridus TaxID=1738132 RepID=A0AAD7B8M8_9AGAR|nr:hypothetical protein FB45DRAFT_1036199 [Roridomyces roridus]